MLTIGKKHKYLVDITNNRNRNIGISNNRIASRDAANEDGDLASKMSAPIFVGEYVLSVCGTTIFLQHDGDAPSVHPTPQLRTKPSSFDAILTLQKQLSNLRFVFFFTCGKKGVQGFQMKNCQLRAGWLGAFSGNVEKVTLNLGMCVLPAMAANHQNRWFVPTTVS